MTVWTPPVWMAWTFKFDLCGVKPQGFLSGVDGVDQTLGGVRGRVKICSEKRM